MNKIFKITGVLALVVTLICNLQYAAFYSVKNSPSGAKAAWTYADMYGSTVYCGSSPNRTLRAGTWILEQPTVGGVPNPDFNHYVDGTYPYQYGYYYFVPSNSGTDCALNSPSSDTNFRQWHTYEITAPSIPFVGSY